MKAQDFITSLKACLRISKAWKQANFTVVDFAFNQNKPNRLVF
jgi:hypothetical protein